MGRAVLWRLATMEGQFPQGETKEIRRTDVVLRLPWIYPGGSDPLPLSCFRLWDRRFTAQGIRPRAISGGPSTVRAEATVAPTLSPRRPVPAARRLLLIAPTASRCPVQPHCL